ncbi:MAG: helix-turn-helix transcriptional regulator [Cyanobacteria bacterium P01_A01_bin.17]
MSKRVAKGKGGNMFSQRRIELGYTQEEAAQVVGVKTRAFQNWEAQGHPGPLLLDQVARLCEFYQWSFQQLLDACFPGGQEEAAAVEKLNEYHSS